MTDLKALREAAETARGFAKAYPDDVFLLVSKEDRVWLKAERPGLQDAIAGDMGRHLGQFFAENAKMLDAAADALEKRSPEDEAEHFIQAAIDRAPEPLRRLGEWLADQFDEDRWAFAERLLLGAVEQANATAETNAARIRALEGALRRLSELTPARANARDARSLHLTVKAIADSALTDQSCTTLDGGSHDR